MGVNCGYGKILGREKNMKFEDSIELTFIVKKNIDNYDNYF